MLCWLLKQPENSFDQLNKVRVTSCIGCPKSIWRNFEKRFGIQVYETYGATDFFGKSSFNFGNAPAGSIGKPASKTKYRIVDKELNNVEPGEPGQLIFEIGDSIRGEYYKNPEATKEKFHDGYLFTGDLVYQDLQGFLYYYGRSIDAIRVKGENVSPYEVEQTMTKFRGIAECAAYGIKSELTDDEIMISYTTDSGNNITIQDLIQFMEENLPKYAVPRYYKHIDKFMKSGSNKIIKNHLKEQGIDPGTFDREKDGYL